MIQEQRKPLKIILIVCITAAILIPGYMAGYFAVNHMPMKLGHLVYGIVFSFFISISISLANFYTVSILEVQYPWTNRKLKRFFSELLITNFNASLIISIVIIIIDRTFPSLHHHNSGLISSLYNNITIAIIVNTVVVAIYEGQSLVRKWLHSLIEVEQLKREKAESQYAALKNQLSPHFLFNSLNSLNSLIRVSPERAIEFVEKFSRIYRYVLDVSEKIVIELHEELDFLQSYYFLQKIRFGDNLIIHVQVEAHRMNDFIMPLAVQLLIENAIKHNEVSSQKPLTIIITTEPGFLVISNNLQLKNRAEESKGIGLVNLVERYKHFTDVSPLFYTTSERYIAKIPLLKENDE